MNTAIILDYLSELCRNNNREWYHAHKAEQREASAQFEILLQELILRIGETDTGILHNVPKDLTFKLVRDTRFSHDKSPYNPAFRAHIGAKGKLPVPVGYYIMIKPDNQSFLGGGLFADMFKDATAMVRDHISSHPDEWAQITGAEDFRSLFSVKGTSLKNVPAGYDRNHPQAEYLKYKSWYVEHVIPDEELLREDLFIEHAADIFRRMQPFNDYLNRALSGFQMPSR
ncbi:DUF2461 domain-containing protein [Ruminococcus gauvreauii]|uniref:DUF2461 domain-containing protein n=1 Tax=Ruminococcus gauvreauii TaxID=438033 RepID=A0ABY5VFY0_9FIRM|nr:DUF2461 domain-containing protein [Ruminococcus gauvreauii]UWP59143.1 DUF2461 domain-containing protein [Ruminococcus gauvreauii]